MSRLVRWYLPVFVVLGLGVFRLGSPSASPRGSLPRTAWMALVSFVAVFLVQMLAPFPYEDYQVPAMGLLVVFAIVALMHVSNEPSLLLVLGMTWAMSFGSPLLEKWSTNGQDRFWSLKKEKCELAQLRDVARRIEALDPGGKDLFTQDAYLAVETNRRLPDGFEMGPYSVLSDADIVRAVEGTQCPVAALSGYCFAVEMPKGVERPIGDQIRYWELLKRRFSLVDREDAFGQNATPLLILKRK